MIVRLGNRVVTKSESTPSISVSVPQSQGFNPSDVAQGSPFGGGSLTVRTSNSSISYTTKRKADRYLTNWCVHSKSRFMYTGNALSSQRVARLDPGFNGWYTTYYQGHIHAVAAHSTALLAAEATGVSFSSLLYPGDAQADIDDSLSSLKPDLTQLSLPNFLLDIGDIKQLVELWSLKRSLAKNVAGAHLNYKFGWKPTLGDLQGMCSAIRDTLSTIAEFDKQSGNVHHSTRKFSKLSNTITGSFNYQGDVKQPCNWTLKEESFKRCSAAYRILPLPVTRDIKFMFKAYLDALGFELNPKIIWDAVPFTFVIDWFLGVGTWLDRHRIETLELPVSWIDSSAQFKSKLSVSSELRLDVGSTISSQTAWPATVTERDFFIRLPIYPLESVFSGLGWKLPTLNQALLMVSLGTVLRK